MNWYFKAFKQYADFKGRARRKEYFIFALINISISFLLGFIAGLLGVDGILIGGIYILGVTIPSISIGIRRMHDVGKSGIYFFIPVYNIILIFTEGEGVNKYGLATKN